MHKKVNVIIMAIALLSFLTAPAIAQNPNKQNGKPDFAGKPEQTGKPESAGKNGPAGKSNIAHLYLYEKDPAGWEIIEDGAWGKMKYNLTGPEFDFVFNGHGLETGSTYTLIYYPDPWPGAGLICLGSGLANEAGDVHIMGSVDTGDLPKDYDSNEGAKVWLVLTGDVTCPDLGTDPMAGEMTDWNPGSYLFERDLLSFDDIN